MFWNMDLLMIFIMLMDLISKNLEISHNMLNIRSLEHVAIIIFLHLPKSLLLYCATSGYSDYMQNRLD